MSSVAELLRLHPLCEHDPSTNSNFHEFVHHGTALRWDVDFDASKVTGTATHTLEPVGTPSRIVLDTSFLEIHSVAIDGVDTPFTVLPRAEPLGAPLVVEHAPAAKFTLQVAYSTTAECTALQWLTPAQTDGGKHPYLFSQCQAIHARLLLPCFDTPSVKVPYSYRVTLPLPVVVSGRPATSTEGNEYSFDQPIPIPSYLVAIASGDLVLAPIGPRLAVYLEPAVIDRCQHEFCADTERFITTAEELVFPYEWDTYNLLVLVLSFPYGGMENPNMTFATPTLLSGDRQNVDVVAHELAHSWSGNLVTNASWEHFWLNEGWTVYLERRIIGRLHGDAYRDFSAIIGWEQLEREIVRMDATPRYTTLVQDLSDRLDPDDAFLSVPYEKGLNLLLTVERAVGGTAVFDPFIPHYFSKFAHKSVTTKEFLDTLYGFFGDKQAELDLVDWETWLYGQGLPPKPVFDTTLVDECYSLAASWAKAIASGSVSELERFVAADVAAYTANQTVVFLDTVAEKCAWGLAMGAAAARHMREAYGYATLQNAEVVLRFFRVSVRARVEEEYPRLAAWLTTVGRMKFVRPGYVLLASVDKALAVETFRAHELGYHPICRAFVKKDLGL